MVREKPSGQRAAKEGIIVELSNEKTIDAMLSYKIDHFSDKNVFIDFRGAYVIDLSILDLCVFNQEGQAKIRLDTDCPDGIIKSWQIRFKLLQLVRSLPHQPPNLIRL